MDKVMLIVHFLGLAMGIGTSIGFMFLGMAAAKLPDGERQKFQLNSFALAKMGQIGLVLLIISGGYMMTPYWGMLGQMPILVTKLVLVLVLAALIGIISSKARKAATGDIDAALAKIKTLGMLALFTGIAIIVLAVISFE